jgi:hypothetical protein
VVGDRERDPIADVLRLCPLDELIQVMDIEDMSPQLSTGPDRQSDRTENAGMDHPSHLPDGDAEVLCGVLQGQ